MPVDCVESCLKLSADLGTDKYGNPPRSETFQVCLQAVRVFVVVGLFILIRCLGNTSHESLAGSPCRAN